MSSVIFQARILACFTKMASVRTQEGIDLYGNKYLAKELSEGYVDWLKACTIASVDDGWNPDKITRSLFSYTGVGAGTGPDLSSNIDLIKQDFEVLFENMNLSDSQIADGIANIIHSYTNGSAIETSSTGMIKLSIGTPPPPPVPWGPLEKQEGELTIPESSKLALSSLLKSTFLAMKTMVTGGDKKFATDLSTGLLTYLNTGIVNIDLFSTEPPPATPTTPLRGEGIGNLTAI